MPTLPNDFEQYTRQLLGPERYERFLASLAERPPVSVRLNPFKPFNHTAHFGAGAAIPWCHNALWLDERPDFTLDPLLHAGCYYVQEAGSMFLDRVLRQHVADPAVVLDLCAAPGGKSTLARAALPEGSLLYANEPDHRRANILMENLQKQGHPGVVVTNNYARDYQRAGLRFDVILADVPCSGEGMFRKDPGAIADWSMRKVIDCAALQRSIIEDIWPCLRPGGLLVYSTCTFNTRENEENVSWIAQTLGAELLPVGIREEWGVEGSLLEDFAGPVYRFIPGLTRSEGLFMAVLRKHPGPQPAAKKKRADALRVLSNGSYPPIVKGKDRIPQHAEALLATLPADRYPTVELPLALALAYLRREAVVLPPSAPRGFLTVSYLGHPLGFVKNLGSRANNLYPQEWRIRISSNTATAIRDESRQTTILA